MIKFLLFVLATPPLPAASSTIGSAYHGAEQPLGAPADERRLIHFPLKPHHRQRRLLTTESQDNNIAPLYQGIGTHYVDLYVGTPIRQKQTLIVDTGSEWTGFPCVPGCCGQHTDDEFNVSASSTFSKHERSCNSDQEQESCAQKQRTSCSESNDECRVRMDYSEESFWTAYEAVDQVSIVAENTDCTTLLLQFGCQTDTTRLFQAQLADGIMGMNDAPLSFWRQAGVESFSLCFSSPLHGDLEDQAGSMSLGGYDERLHLSEMQFAKRTKGRGPERNYRVEVRDLSLRQVSTNGDGTAVIKPLQGLDANLINQHGTIVDSGTTDTYFPTSAGSAFRSSFRDLTGMTWSNKMQLSRKQLQTLPKLVVHLAGADGDDGVLVEIPPLHYMEPSYAEDEMYEPAIFFESSENLPYSLKARKRCWVLTFYEVTTSTLLRILLALPPARATIDY